MWHFVPQLFCDFLACIVPRSILRLNYPGRRHTHALGDWHHCRVKAIWQMSGEFARSSWGTIPLDNIQAVPFPLSGCPPGRSIFTAICGCPSFVLPMCEHRW